MLGVDYFEFLCLLSTVLCPELGTCFLLVIW